MPGRSLDCPRCGGTMVSGFLIDTAYGGTVQPKWAEGEPKKSLWTGLKLRGKEQFPVTTWRCRRCGYLESYA